MANIEIENNIKIPERRIGGPIKYRWPEIGIGDSFFLSFIEAKDTLDENRIKNNVAASACRYGKSHNKKFAVLRVTEEKKDGKSERGLRIWRIH